MGEFWDAERGSKAATWFGFYVLLWLLQQFSCKFGLPNNCRQALEPMEVLTELPLLLAFAVCQAFFCDILDATRSHALSKRHYFPVFVVASALITSALMNNAGFADLHGRGDEEDTDTPRDLTPAEAVASVILIIFVALVFIYHYFLAWKLLPGGWLGWNLVSGQVPEDTPPPIRENRFLQYAATALIVTTYVTLFAAFAHNRGDGWDYHYVLLSWAMSLLCTFDDPISVGWLGITTGAFLQGVGAYSFRVLFRD